MTATKLKSQGNTEEFQKASVPFPTSEDANSAVQKFWDEVYQIRCKYGIANVSFVIEDQIAESGTFFVNGHIGDIVKQESMATWHYGQSSAARQKMVQNIVRSGMEHAILALEDKQ